MKLKLLIKTAKQEKPKAEPAIVKTTIMDLLKEVGLQAGLFNPDPVLLSPETMPIMDSKPQNSNYTDITMYFMIDDGEIHPKRLELYNGDMDPNGEEKPGSDDEKREKQHYAAVISLVTDFLLAENEPVEVERTNKETDTEGEASDSVDSKGKKKTPKEAGVEVSLA